MTGVATRPRLLLVEDDRATYSALRGILNLRGWDVRVATSVAEARAILDESVDAVILDLMLPDGHGEGLLPDIRAPRRLAAFKQAPLKSAPIKFARCRSAPAKLAFRRCA